MTEPWWRSRDLPADPDVQPQNEFAELIPATSRDVRAATAARIAGFTAPEWSPATSAATGVDAGVALIKAFAEQAAPVLTRANQLTGKYTREHLRVAGVAGREPGVGRVTVVLTLLPTATASVPIAAGTQLTAPGAAGGDQVVFETERQIFATAATVAGYVAQVGDRAARLAPADVTAAAPVAVFGPRPQPGNGLWLGLAGPAPFPRLALRLVLAGAGATGSGADPPVVGWDLLTGDGLVPADVHLDETAGLTSSGDVEVGTRREWPELSHPALLADPAAVPLRWLRLGLRQGQYDTAPALIAVLVNAVTAEGVETVRNEVLTPVDDPGQVSARSFRLTRTPVLRDSVRIVVDAPDPADLFDTAPVSSAATAPEWTEVPSLALQEPYRKVFELDGTTGVVTFGDGVHGAAVPAGFRHVTATSYRTGGGANTAVPASAGFAPRGTVPFLAGIDNPEPATGGRDAETTEALLARGPDLVGRSDRVVTVADAEVLAPDADAGIGRVIALPGVDTDGTVRPGRLTLVVVGTGTHPGPAPVPPARVLAAVASYVTDRRDPRSALGARVVVRPARFVGVELGIDVRLDPDADQSSTVLAVSAAADAYLDPRTGGEDGRGWPLGAAIRYRHLVAVLAGVGGVTSVRRVGILVGGRSSPPCTDAVIPAYTLPWSGPHLVVPS